MSAPFGRLVTAMVTPFDGEGGLDLDRAQQLAAHLVDEMANDALVISGTTGESPTTSDDEKAALVRAVKQAVGDRAQVIAGVGTFDTRHSEHLAKQAAEAGADGLLVVTPYYSRPTQQGVVQHVLAVAGATDLPVMLYDIPQRTGTPLTVDTLLRLGEVDQVVAVKDARLDLTDASRVLAETKLAYYSGDDAMTLPLMSVGGTGLVGTATHFTGRRTRELIDAAASGHLDRALAVHRELLDVNVGVFAAPGVTMVKAALKARGLDVGGVRLPMTMPTDDQVRTFVTQLEAAQL